MNWKKTLFNSMLLVCAIVGGLVVFHGLGGGKDHIQFDFKTAGIVHVNNTPYLKLHRSSDRPLVGTFFVRMSHKKDHLKSCMAVKSPDLFEVRDIPFTTHFLSRFEKDCVRTLKPGPYVVTVTYAIRAGIWRKTTEFVLKRSDIRKRSR